MAKKLRFLFTLLFVMAATLSWGEKYKLTISPLDFKTSSYNDNNTVKTTQAVSTVNASKTLDVSWASYQVYQNSGAMQWQKNVGYIYNKTNLGTIKSVNIEISTNGGTFTTYYGTSEKPSSSTEVGGGFFKTNVGSSTGKTTKMEIIFEIEDEPSVSAPTFAPAAGTYSEAQNVSIACDTESANIYYTLDGSEPTDASTVFTSAIPITETTTVKAIAYKDGKSSDVAEATYTIIPAGAEYVTLWSEDFSSYSQGDVPNGGIYSYNCTNGGGTTRVYDEALADGSKPELLVAKNNGSFTAVVPLKNVVGDLTLTYKTNANSLNVYTTTEGIEGSITSTTARTHSVTFKGITANTTSITIVFKATTGSNVRLDDIVLTGLQLPSAVKTPVISLASGTYFGTQSVRITCETADAKIYYTLDGTDPTSASTLYESAIPISETTTLKAIAIKDNESSNVATAEYTIAPTYENNNAANVAATSTDSPVRLTLTEALVVYKNGNNTYLKDASGGMLIYGENNLNVGDKVTGHVDGDLTLYSGLPEIKKPVFNVETVSQDNEVTATVVDAADLKANPMKYVNQYVKVSPAKFAEDFTGSTSNATNANFTVGETELILRNSFKLGVEVSKDKDYAISGMATIFIKDGETNVQLYPTNTDSDIEELHFVAQIGDVKYETLQAAFAAAADGATITLLANCFGNGIVVAEGKYTNGLTVDFGGYTFTVDGATVGSTGTETQAFQLLRNNNITFKNGTITSEKAKILVQNYSNLTLEKMTLILANEGYAYGYTLSNNNGKIKIDNSTIKANTGGGFAFDVCRYSSYPSVEVTVTGESVINGNVEVFASDNDAKDGFKLMLESGKINGDIVIDASASAAMSATPDKAIIMENDSFGQAAPEGYKWESNGDGTSTLKVCDYVAQIGDVKYETLQAAFAAAADGATITLLANCFGNGIVVAEGKYTNGLTVDFGGYTFTVDGATVGSTGTETQAFQLLRNNNITFKNGTITSEKAKILVQNYSNLTLEKMTLILANEGYAYGYTLSNNNGKIKIDNSTIKANTGGGFAFDVCRYSSYPSVEVTVTGESVINGNVEVFASDNDAKDGFKLMLESGKINGDIVIDASASAAMSATPDKAIIMENDSFGQAAPEGYKWESNGDGTSTLKKVTAPAVVVSAPVVFHDSGEYEAGLSVPMYAQAGAKIYYTTDGSEPTTASTEYTGALTIKNATTLKAIAVLDGVASAVVTREYTIKAAADEIVAIDGYYSIKNNGNGKFVNVAGRKTVTFTDAIDDKAGTVIKVKANKNGQVEVLRSQGVDLPGYAKKAMNYVPEIVELVVNKLHAAESGEILGEHGLDAIMKKFNDSFDYHLYVEKVDAGYRIYGKTPSMKPVVDFYAENKANVDIKLPKLEAFINSAIQKVLQKTGGRGASILTDFSLHEIWEKMGGTLTEPTDETSTAKFYEEVLSSEANVWNFAYQTAMKYWEPLIKHEKVQQNLDKLGDYAKYLEKVENIQPDFKYYIVGKENGVDFISDGNIDIQNNAARTIWTLEPRADFKVTFDPENVKNGGTEYYATLYTDFGYELAEGMKAYKVTEVDSKDYAKLEEIGTQIPAQTPVLLMTTDLSKTTLTVKDGGDAVTGNLLVGPDYLINEYQIKTAQVEGLFNLAKDNMGEEFYNNYVKEYEHLMLRNAGTVNNKYFFGLEDDDMNLCTYKNESDEEDCVVRNLGNGEKRLGFYSNWKVEANKAFLVNEKFKPVKLTKIPDVNRDGMISVDDVTAMIDIIMEKDKTVPYKYDHDAALITNDNIIDINDVNYLIDIILEVKEIEE